MNPPLEKALVSLCVKIAKGITGLPKVPSVRGASVSGAATQIGRWNPAKSTTTMGPPVAGAKSGTLAGASASVINPNRSIKQAIVAGTPMKATAGTPKALGEPL